MNKKNKSIKKDLSDPIREIMVKFQNYINPPDFEFAYLKDDIPNDDVINFVDKSLDKFDDFFKVYLTENFISSASKSIQKYYKENIPPDNNHYNSYKVIKHLGGYIPNQLPKLEINDISDKQLVYLFRLLHLKGYIISDKKNTAKALSMVFGIKEDTAKQYLSANINAPMSIFDCAWEEL